MITAVASEAEPPVQGTAAPRGHSARSLPHHALAAISAGRRGSGHAAEIGLMGMPAVRGCCTAWEWSWSSSSTCDRPGQPAATASKRMSGGLTPIARQYRPCRQASSPTASELELTSRRGPYAAGLRSVRTPAVLAEDQRAVGAHSDLGRPGHAVAFLLDRLDVMAREALEIVAIALPVRVEAKPPGPGPREADAVDARAPRARSSRPPPRRRPGRPRASGGRRRASSPRRRDAPGCRGRRARRVTLSRSSRSRIRSRQSRTMPRNVLALVPVERHVSRNHSPCRNSWPWNSIGMPGAVSTSAAPSVERFCAARCAGSPGAISCGMRALPFATSSWLSV